MEIKELKQISVNNLEFIKDEFLKNKAFYSMMVIHTRKNEKPHLINAVLDNEKLIENRFQIMADLGIEMGVRTFIKKEFDSVDAVFSLSEAWMSKHDKKEKNILMPSQDPKRMEVLISAGVSSDNKTFVDINIIRRTWNEGKIGVSFEPMDIKEDGGDFQVNASLLEGFWTAFNLIRGFWEKMKKEKDKEVLKRLVETKDTESIVNSFLTTFHSSLEEKLKKAGLSNNIKNNA